jgi:outer membrane protein assembly factor BamB
MHRVISFTVGLLAAGMACGAPHQDSVWTFRTDRPWLAGHSHAFTPAVDRESVFFCGGYFWNYVDDIHALSLRDGRLMWKHQVGDCMNAPWLIDGTLVVHSQESRYGPCIFQGFEPATGTVRWRREFQENVPNSISRCVIHDAVVGASIVFAFAGQQDVQKVRAADGALERFTAEVQRRDQRIWLTASGSDAWFGVGMRMWRWPAGGSRPVEAVALATDAGSPWYAAATGTQLLLGDRNSPGVLRAFDLTTGRLRWEQTALPTIVAMSADDQAIYLNVSRKPLELIALDLTTGRELWTAGVGGFYSPTKTDGWLYANGSASVVIVDPRTGRIAHAIKAEAEVITTPVRVGDLVLFGTINGALHAERVGELPRAAGVSTDRREALPGRTTLNVHEVAVVDKTVGTQISLLR